MKKMVLRVLSIMMIAAIMVISTNSVAALAAENLDISSRVFLSGEAPADNADGSITFSEQKSMKCSFALPTVLNAGDSVTVNVKLQFNSADDAGVRFFGAADDAQRSFTVVDVEGGDGAISLLSNGEEFFHGSKHRM